MVCDKKDCEGAETWECWWNNSPCPKEAFERGKREGAAEERERIARKIEKYRGGHAYKPIECEHANGVVDIPIPDFIIDDFIEIISSPPTEVCPNKER